ncbi:type I restriction-modification system subunit M/S [Streptomyces sp. MNU89]|uniref:type I restriction-modification system subunit M/S n=1 Tax=Streptomyces sp. MNU89 TaxID=2560025 RepID=UPI001E3C8D2B|nr:type I restriction-modification system subunit M/S [Streptomyces sp. MNU89]MCC9739437.1 N-6 DNA methylase [Streptomyces sp. MNU89]
MANWERRHQDFPAPVPSSGHSGTDVFRADEVAAWLGRRTVPANVRREGELAGTTFGDRFRAGLDRGNFSAQDFVHRLLAEADRFRGQLAPAENMLLLLGLVHTWGTSPAARVSATSLRTVLRTVLDRDVAGHEQVATLIEVFSQQGPGTRAECAAVFDLLVDRYRSEYGRREGGELFTPKSVARTMARMLSVAVPRPRRVHDPFCRAGEVLTAILAELPESGIRPCVTGTTPSSDALHLATMNLTLHGAEDAVFHLGMEIEGPGPRDGSGSPWPSGIDWIVTNPPFAQRLSASEEQRTWRYGPPGSRGDFAWLQHVMDQLAPGGRAAVVMPEGAGFIGGRPGRIRGAMIEDGAVECVVALPPQLFAVTAIPVNIWILTRPVGRCEEVLFIDGSALGSMTGPALRELSEGDIAAVVDAYAAWHHGMERTESTPSGAGAGAGAVASRALKLDELRDRTYMLTPRSLTAPELPLMNPQVTEQVMARRMERLESAAARLQELSGNLERSGNPWRETWSRAAPSGTGESIPSGWRQERLGTLAEITVGPGGRRRDKADDTGRGIPVVRPAAVRGHRILHEGVTWVPEDEAKSLTRYRLKPGDVVMTRTGTLGRCALVTEAEEGWIFGTHLVRIRPSELSYADYLLGFLERPEAQSWISRRARGTAVQSVSSKDLYDLPVLLPPRAEQQKIGRVLNILDQQRQTHTELIAALDAYRAELADLLMSGRVLLPTEE